MKKREIKTHSKHTNQNLALKRIVELTIKHVKRNKWLSYASILVILFSFLISTIFVVLGIGSNKGLDALEKQGQIIVFFELGTDEDEIFKVQDKFQKLDLVATITYISQEEAQRIYIQDFENDVDLIESVTTGALPPSLEIRAKDLDQVDSLLKLVIDEKDKNQNINEVIYYKDFIDRLRTAVKFARIGGIALVVFLTCVSVMLVLITIGFNIRAHQDEIKTMRLIGSSKSYIRTPYIIEGAFYGLIGAFSAGIIILVIWYGSLFIIRQTDFYFLLTQMLRELSLLSLIKFDIKTVLAMLGIEILTGIIVGATSSMLAVLKYMEADL